VWLFDESWDARRPISALLQLDAAADASTIPTRSIRAWNVYRSTDDGNSWTAISGDLTRADKSKEDRQAD
jgi:hypothetical protein